MKQFSSRRSRSSVVAEVEGGKERRVERKESRRKGERRRVEGQKGNRDKQKESRVE